MPDKRIKKLIRKHLKWWVYWLGLTHWNIALKFCKSSTEDGGVKLAGAHVDTLWEYQRATIEFYINDLTHLVEREIESLIVHELIHIMVNEMYESGVKHEERVVTTLENAFLWVKNA